MAESGESKLLTPALRVKLERIASEEGFVQPSFRLGDGSKSGDGFIGVVFRVYVDEQVTGSNRSTLPLIVKRPPAVSTADHIFSVDRLFRRETVFYDVIQPAFNKFQKQRAIAQSSPSSPRCFDAKDDIILQDMRPLGYAMKEGNYDLDFAHCSAFLRELGRFHAVSFAMKDQEPGVYSSITRDLEETYITPDPSQIMKDRFDRAVAMALEEFKKRVTLADKERYVDILERFLDENYYKKLTDLLEGWRAEPYAVINHGDCWSNNALFKYDTDDETAPSGLCLLDYQIVRHASPATDVTYLIFTSTSKTMRDEHYEELLRAYYGSLTRHIRELGSDPEKLFPYAAFEEQLQTFGKFSLGMSAFDAPLITYKAADEPIATAVGGGSTLDPAFTLTHANSDTCWSRVCDVYTDMVDLGYLV